MRLRRTNLTYSTQVFAPLDARQIAGPPCLTCGRVVQKEEIVEEGPTFCRVLFTCHGREELRTYEFETREWGYDELRRMRLADRLFDPTVESETGHLVVGIEVPKSGNNP